MVVGLAIYNYLLSVGPNDLPMLIAALLSRACVQEIPLETVLDLIQLDDRFTQKNTTMRCTMHVSMYNHGLKHI